jgi:myo-inositol-1(or 4)-monophosphatase
MNEHDRELIDVALAAARRAAELQRFSAGQLDPARWGEKGVSDFVTEVDVESERIIVETLRERFPAHGMLAEEGTIVELAPNTPHGPGADDGPRTDDRPRSGDGPGSGDRPEAGDGDRQIRWIIDPLDGTTNWLHGYPEYAVSIAALDEDGLRAGVVVNAATGEEFVAVRGAGARRNGDPIHTSEVTEPRLALLGTGFPFKKLELLPFYLALLDRALRSTSGVRRAGAAALDLCALACGRLDAFWEMWLMPWDVAAGAIIVREAGGAFGPLELQLAPGGGMQLSADPGARGPAPFHVQNAEALGQAVDGGRDFVSVCEGRSEWRRPGGGAYMAANAHLLEELRRLLSG